MPQFFERFPLRESPKPAHSHPESCPNLQAYAKHHSDSLVYKGAHGRELPSLHLREPVTVRQNTQRALN